MMTTGLHALIFDVDGTLADTERFGHLPAFNRAFAAAGLDWRWSEDLYGELLAVTGGKERIRRFVEGHRPAMPPGANIDALIAELHAAKNRFFAQLLESGQIPLRPGVQRLIEEARGAGLRLAIATTTSPENVTALIRHNLGAAALDWFEVIGAGDVVPAKKPAPDIYHYVLEHLRLAPAQCIAFEDSHNGLRATLGAGLKTIVAVNGYTREEDFTGACIVLDHWGEPGEAFQVLAGDAQGQRYLDLALVRRLHAGD